MGRTHEAGSTNSTRDDLRYRARDRLEASALSDPDSPMRPTAGGGIAVVLASAFLAVAGWGPLGESMRIRWTVGAHWGPEFAPTALVLAAFPLGLFAAYLGLRRFGTHLAHTDGLPARWLYEASVLTALLLGLVVELGLVVANLA